MSIKMEKLARFIGRKQGVSAGFAAALCGALALAAAAQETVVTQASVEVASQLDELNGMHIPAKYVSIHVDGGDMRQVLNSFAMQANRNIVLGPEVTNNMVTIHLNNVQWDNALDVILKPYGYGYRQVGDATVVGELNKLKLLEAVEPLQSRIYQLQYLDASDVDGIIKGMLSPRGTNSIITAKGQKGWKDLASKSSRSTKGSGTSLEMRAREDDQIYSKTIVVTDVPSVLDNVSKTLTEIDRMPQQILVEARFMEVNEDFLRDIGVEMGGSFDIDGAPISLMDQFFSATPGVFEPKSEDVTGVRSALNTLRDTTEGDTDTTLTLTPDSLNLNTYGQLSASGRNWGLFISMLEEDEDTKTLSAPKVLTLNNQEAAIVVGTRYPIIESQFDSGSTGSVKSESLSYYESIGIQLNVVPQICAGDFIKMVVRPSVTEIVGFSGLNDYPIIKTRDTETQVLAANSETIVIGGLLEERKSAGVFKVPYLGDIPYIGRLFRRDTADNKTIDLLIFISATVVDEDNYDLIVEKMDTEDGETAVIDLMEDAPFSGLPEDIPQAAMVDSPADETDPMMDAME